jgi:antitoxin VapB
MPNEAFRPGPAKPASSDELFAALRSAEVPPDFLDQTERAQQSQDRDPFEGWRE